MRSPVRWILILAWTSTQFFPDRARSEEPPVNSTSTEWRCDEDNVVIAREINRAYARLPFDREYEGVLAQCPFQGSWTTGPNLPVAWKGGVAGIIGDRVVMAGGLWMPGRRNLALAYDLRNRTYEDIQPPPYETAYTQGACDGTSLYVVGGRSAGRRVSRLSRGTDGRWNWEPLPMLPESEGKGRWLGVSHIIPGKWLFLTTGHPTGTQSEIRQESQLQDWRLRLDQPAAQWEPMAPYPGGPRALVCGAVARNKLFVFGGAHPDSEMRAIFANLIRDYGLMNVVPYAGAPHYRDAYCYDPDTDRWQKLRSLPLPMAGGTGIVLEERYILIMGETETKSQRVGKTKRAALVKLVGGQKGSELEPQWTGYGDLILCYDLEQDNYSRLGVMLYGVGTCPWVNDGNTLYGFGGEPYHGFNDNTENVLQIGHLEARPSSP